MATEPKLEAYLAELDKYLLLIPVSDRAEIIIEIKSHIIAAQNKNPNQDMSAILHSLGDPEIVAKRYLQERGLQSSLPPKVSSMMWLPASIKWLVIGFLSFIAIIVMTVLIAIWRFSPLISIDDRTDTVSLAGGLIQIHSSEIDHTVKSVKESLSPTVKTPMDKPHHPESE